MARVRCGTAILPRLQRSAPWAVGPLMGMQCRKVRLSRVGSLQKVCPESTPPAQSQTMYSPTDRADQTCAPPTLRSWARAAPSPSRSTPDNKHPHRPPETTHKRPAHALPSDNPASTQSHRATLPSTRYAHPATPPTSHEIPVRLHKKPWPQPNPRLAKSQQLSPYLPILTHSKVL